MRFKQRNCRIDARASLERRREQLAAVVVIVVVLGVVVLDGGHGADFEGFRVVSLRSPSAGLDVVQGLDLAADGQGLLLADRCSASLAQVGDGQRIGPQVRLKKRIKMF